MTPSTLAPELYGESHAMAALREVEEQAEAERRWKIERIIRQGVFYAIQQWLRRTAKERAARA